MIFETERLIVRKLVFDDLLAFHEMQSNPKVMQFADGDIKSFDEHEIEIKELINKYNLPNNDFWIYAVERKTDHQFVGTVALVKDKREDEIGYRFLEKYWANGYASEICKGLILYCKKLKMNKLIAYAIDKNIASVKILERLNFKIVHRFISDDIKLPETKYELIL
ncbi:GNAT family N-acetyltransferase [uncultured Polaribacter sp.]|uniref:GNAT family N-acetyltransferase n=1 Tax=uncultured Polaribacter sp. TaxID=174711 RepID=UPI00260DDE7E|nr:GNAT family N-acetyltransferase [uncultured Polaribacter sp.]